MTKTEQPRLTAAQKNILATARKDGAITMYGQNSRPIDRLMNLGLIRYASSTEVNERLGRTHGMQMGYVLTDAGEKIA
jgi:hypothetical protein